MSSFLENAMGRIRENPARHGSAGCVETPAIKNAL
jgi:hypothetical protein